MSTIKDEEALYQNLKKKIYGNFKKKHICGNICDWQNKQPRYRFNFLLDKKIVEK